MAVAKKSAPTRAQTFISAAIEGEGKVALNAKAVEIVKEKIAGIMGRLDDLAAASILAGDDADKKKRVEDEVEANLAEAAKQVALLASLGATVPKEWEKFEA